MGRSDLYIVDRTYPHAKFIPWDGKIEVNVEGGGDGGSSSPNDLPQQIAALAQAIERLNQKLDAIEQKLESGINLNQEAVGAIALAAKRPAMQFRARANQITSQWTSPAGLQAIAFSNRGTAPATFTDVDENNTAKAVTLPPRGTWTWAVSEDIDEIVPVTIDATGTTVAVSWLQQVPN